MIVLTRYAIWINIVCHQHIVFIFSIIDYYWANKLNKSRMLSTQYFHSRNYFISKRQQKTTKNNENSQIELRSSLFESRRWVEIKKKFAILNKKSSIRILVAMTFWNLNLFDREIFNHWHSYLYYTQTQKLIL